MIRARLREAIDSIRHPRVYDWLNSMNTLTLHEVSLLILHLELIDQVFPYFEHPHVARIRLVNEKCAQRGQSQLVDRLHVMFTMRRFKHLFFTSYHPVLSKLVTHDEYDAVILADTTHFIFELRRECLRWILLCLRPGKPLVMLVSLHQEEVRNFAIWPGWIPWYWSSSMWSFRIDLILIGWSEII